MKYFIVSDIHGNYDKLIKSLSDVNFNSEIDTLIVNGDAFDRGHQNKKVLQFIMSCPNRILIMGNHDLRLKEAIKNGRIEYFDVYNGLDITLIDFFGDGWPKNIDNELLPLVEQYLSECVWYYKLNDYIITHTWLPLCDYDYNKKWEKATDSDWENIIWEEQDAFLLQNKGKKFPFKLIVGHRPTFYIRYKLNKLKNKFNDINNIIEEYTDIFEYKDDYKDVIFIDGGCTFNLPVSKVNTFIIES